MAEKIMIILYTILSIFVMVIGLAGLFFAYKLITKKEGVLWCNPYIVAPAEGNPQITLGNEHPMKDIEDYMDRRVKEFRYAVK